MEAALLENSIKRTKTATVGQNGLLRLTKLNSGALGLTLLTSAGGHLFFPETLEKQYLEMDLGVGASVSGLIQLAAALAIFWPRLFSLVATAIAAYTLMSIIGSCRKGQHEIPVRLVFLIPAFYLATLFRSKLSFIVNTRWFSKSC